MYSYAMLRYSTLATCTVAGVPVQKLKSTRTGIVVCLAQVEGPLVNGCFCLATEAHDHDGLPHTLEHLLFLGSETYPYKGVLDVLANRCLAQGTNAWTDINHTRYTVATAGSEGFLNLLPIYLDHILYPTLTDAAYLTEVHHINGEGDDAGVVYCEMQAWETMYENITYFHLAQHMYPGVCGYKSETGGRLENLRTSCSNEKVRNYHRSFYRPDNLCLIVTGQVEADALFQSLAPFEDKILTKGSLPAMQRPWQSPVPPLEVSVSEEVPFPTDEEADGMVRIAWRGPQATDRYHFAATTSLLQYLVETPVAPLQRELVEVPDPFCSDVHQSVLEVAETCVGFTLTGVPTEKLGCIKDKVLGILSGIAGGSEELDVERMRTVLRRKICTTLNQVEEIPHYFFALASIGDFLFSHAPSDFPGIMDQIPYYRRLLEEPASFWVAMVKKYFVDGPHVAILGRPSHELAENMSSQEKERVGQQRTALGEEGLKTKAQKLEEAIQHHETPIPNDLASSLPVPGTDNIHFHPLIAMGNHKPANQLEELPEYSRFPVHNVPFFFQVNHIHSLFVELTAVLDTASLSKDLKLYIPLYLELLLESPILRNGELIPHEQVVKELAADTVSMTTSLGQGGQRFNCGSYSQAIFVMIKVESEKFYCGVQWLQELLFHLQPTRERLSVIATKMVNDIPRLKRDGIHLAKTILQRIVYTGESTHNLSSMVTQMQFLTSVQTKLKDPSSADQLLTDLKHLRERLTSPDNLRIVMATNVNSLPHANPLDPWLGFLPQSNPKSSVSPADMPKILPSQRFVDPSAKGKTLVAGVGGIDSNFLIQSMPCVKSHDHPDIPAIMVFIAYLCAMEGPMWRKLRGMGLSYRYRMVCVPESGLLTFWLYKSSQLLRAYEVARGIVNGFVTGSTPFEPGWLEAAISWVIYEVIEREETVAAAAHQAILHYLQEVDDSYSKWLLDAVSRVTANDLLRVGAEYFSQLLSPSLANTAVCCNPSKVAEVKSGLERFGHKVETVDDLDQLAVS